MAKAGAPKGNKNAEKWTEEKATELFDKALSKLNEKDTYIVGKETVTGYKYDFLGELLLDLGTYIDIATQLKKRFPSLQGRYRQLQRAMERNCYSNTKKGIINTAVGIVNLKSNHNWTDRQDLTTQGEKFESKTEYHIVDGKDRT